MIGTRIKLLEGILKHNRNDTYVHEKRGVEMETNAIERVKKMLEIANTDATVFPPTYLYNEGWMLRILLSIQSEGVDCFPFNFQSGARWYSEAKLNSPFLPRTRSGDKLAEKHTQPDGVVGHFEFRSETKGGVILKPDSTQFIVTEAKMSSKLSKGVKNAPDYDQAARTVACIAWVIRESNRSVKDLASLGFYVIAPQKRIDRNIFSAEVEKSSIKEKVDLRVSTYSGDGEKYDDLQRWYKDFFIPTLKHIDICCESWESIIHKIDGDSIQNFYKQCQDYSKRKKRKSRRRG